MQQRNRAVETAADFWFARSCKMNRTDFFFRECVVMILLAPRQRNKYGCDQKIRGCEAHTSSTGKWRVVWIL
jgi:hypothetical protein